MARYMSGRSVNLAHTFLDDETALTPATVTVTVTRNGATTATATGPATAAGTVYTFSAGMLPEGVYSVRWDGGATAVDLATVEVIGGPLFTIAELRASDDELTAQRFGTADVKRAREVVESEFQRITGRSFVPRTAFLSVAELPAPGELLPTSDVRSVTVVGGLEAGSVVPVERVGQFAYTPEIPADATGVEVAYGFPSVPDGIHRVGMLYARWLLMAERSAIPDRATSFQPADGGTYTLSTPGRGGAETGLPDVDAVLKGYRPDIVNSVGVA
ncbi:hypothetical protein GKC29_27645 [Micromonospora sp. WMMC415]|uniref:hypothetical protein n=1 Tax=Micromonospora sp. WMMC415 TaxID=2675222 RepID=UPI0012B48368|nr:hypothetical protein [Micromonospora sp. WMMC415]QGN50220.1 hypothetical protein GKC29_27645 [Micromonospora sp. WMMC415]